MTFNIEKAVEVLAQIEYTPQAYNQRMWGRSKTGEPVKGDPIVDSNGNVVGYGSCNTAFCFAGWAAQLDGWTLSFRQTAISGRYDAHIASKGDDRQPISGIGVQLLGIPSAVIDPDAWVSGSQPRLFDEANTLEDVYAEVLRLAPELSREDLDLMVKHRVNYLETLDRR